MGFSEADIPGLSEQIIVVTGGNVGLGLETIRQLKRHGPARIYLAARSSDKGHAAIKQLTESEPNGAPVDFLALDLSSFASIKAAADKIMTTEKRLDILMNNAGVMNIDTGITKDGYEIQFGTNVIGPALFTQLLLPLLTKTTEINQEARVVNLSSGTERIAPSDIYKVDELKSTMSNRHTTARYALSKLAIIHWTKALSECHPRLKCVCVHPGMVATNLHHNATGFFLRPFLHAAIGLFATPVEKGALSQVWAAVSPEAKSGEFYGPVGVPGNGSEASKSSYLSQELWQWLRAELDSHCTF